MRYVIAAVGRSKAGPERDLFDHYRKRLASPLDLREVEERKPLPPASRILREGEMLLSEIPAGAAAIVLDSRGEALSSEELAVKFGNWKDQGRPAICLLIGGADGHGADVMKRADLVLSLGRLTWPHMLVRGVLAEQLYRVESILANHPYHRGHTGSPVSKK